MTSEKWQEPDVAFQPETQRLMTLPMECSTEQKNRETETELTWIPHEQVTKQKRTDEREIEWQDGGLWLALWGNMVHKDVL